MRRGTKSLAVPVGVLLSGLLLTAAFPRWDYSWAAWMALVPLLYVLRGLAAKKAFLAGFAAGLVHYLTLGYWLLPTLQNYGGLPLAAALPAVALLAAYLALYTGLFAMIIAGIRGGAGAALAAGPAIWVALEYVRTFLFSGFPWELLGYSQYQRLALIQVADITGVYGISAAVVLVNLAIVCCWLAGRKKTWQQVPVSSRQALLGVTAAALVIGFIWGYGLWRIGRVEAGLADAACRRLTVVQGNIDQGHKWDETFRRTTVQKYLELAGRQPDLPPDLVIMPETALPFYFTHDRSLTAMVRRAVRRMNVYLLVGAPYFERRDGQYALYNSAFLLSPAGEVTGRYDKAHLVPFGEYVPLGRWLPLGNLVTAVGDFDPGRPGRVIRMDGTGLGVQICYEIIFPGGSRQMAANGADIIVNLTNDAWYGRTSAPYQHFSMAVLRAVETRRPVVRAANTGISGWVTPTGQIGDATPIFVDAVRTYAVPKGSGRTFYVRLGDLFAKICVIVTLFVLWRRYRTGPGATLPPGSSRL
ncbi:MAG: apolipoprotein N-acyltransferase [Desulfosudaceae bacterium]